jgi:Immunoglobulin-like domain of bacterial spore germination
MTGTVRLGAMVLVLGAAAGGSAATAQAAPVAKRTTITDRAAFVRVAVHFGGSALATNAAESSDPNPGNGGSTLRVVQPGIATTAPGVRRHGVRVRIVRQAGRLRIRLTSAKRRFKYLDYRQTRHGVVIKLLKSRPPVPAAEIRRGEGGCIRLVSHVDSGGTITASGTARDLFENTFVLRVRDRRGRIVGQTIVTTAGLNWTETVSYKVPADQPGTLEGFAGSARDGSVACLVQIRVPLAAPLQPPSA